VNITPTPTPSKVPKYHFATIDQGLDGFVSLPCDTGCAPLGCDELLSFDGQLGSKSIPIILGFGTGLCGIEYHANPGPAGPPGSPTQNYGVVEFAIPDKFTIVWNGSRYSTGYRGGEIWNDKMTEVGLPPVEGIGSGTFLFTKTSSLPSNGILEVDSAALVGVNTSRWSAKLLCPAPSTPFAPSGVIGVAGDKRVSLKWSAPASDGGAAITDYVIQHSGSFGSSWITFNDAVSAAKSSIVTGLENDRPYIFRVAAVNSVGTGPYSDPSSIVVPKGPPPPTPTVTPTNTLTPTVTPSLTASNTPTPSPTLSYTPSPTPTKPLDCDFTQKFSGATGVYELPVRFGEKTGIAGIFFDANPGPAGPPGSPTQNYGNPNVAIPDKFTIIWSGIEYTSHFRGGPVWDDLLIGAGYTATSGIGTGILSFNKLSSTPETAIVKIESPIENSRWSFNIKCPSDDCQVIVCNAIMEGESSSDSNKYFRILTTKNTSCCCDVEYKIFDSVGGSTGWTKIPSNNTGCGSDYLPKFDPTQTICIDYIP
jgi:hypothetical protein